MSVGVDRRERHRDRILPDQHGAWGFLLLPVALGTAAAGWSWSLLPVAGAWIAAYPLTWALSGRLTAPRRRERFDRALRVWTVIAVPLMLSALAVRPWLAWVGVAYLVPVAVNLGFARARRERDLRNDLVLVAECCFAVPVVAGVAASRGGWIPPWPVMISADVVLMALVCALTLVGSTLHVKSLIRERANPAFTLGSRLFSVAAIPLALFGALAAGDSAWLAAPFVAVSLRTWFLHDPRWRPARIGLVELGGFVLVAVSAVVSLTG